MTGTRSARIKVALLPFALGHAMGRGRQTNGLRGRD